MSWKDIVNVLHPKRNQNNIIKFPGKENKEFKKQKNEMVILIMTIEKLMNMAHSTLKLRTGRPSSLR